MDELSVELGEVSVELEVVKWEELLEALGFTPADADYAVLKRNLDHVPDVSLPDGFTLRPLAGEHEARLAADVHNGAFGRNWTEDEYIKVMRTPAFERTRELVVTAPEGRFAAFTVIWPDPVSRTGLFEPVGCHRDFTRRGLATAILFAGMDRMKAAGMETALVGCEPSNQAAVSLYRSAGFEPFFETVDYVLE